MCGRCPEERPSPSPWFSAMECSCWWTLVKKMFSIKIKTRRQVVFLHRVREIWKVKDQMRTSRRLFVAVWVTSLRRFFTVLLDKTSAQHLHVCMGTCFIVRNSLLHRTDKTVKLTSEHRTRLHFLFYFEMYQVCRSKSFVEFNFLFLLSELF